MQEAVLDEIRDVHRVAVQDQVPGVDEVECGIADVTRAGVNTADEIELFVVQLPGATVEAVYRSAPDLLSFRQEMQKLAAHADAEGRVPAGALDALREARAGASVERWAQAVLAGSPAEARAETEALDREGIGGTSALWALAECALAALEPQSFYYRRAAPRVPLQAAKARAVLDQVYQADRGLKRGEIRDTELASTLVHTVRRATRG